MCGPGRLRFWERMATQEAAMRPRVGPLDKRRFPTEKRDGNTIRELIVDKSGICRSKIFFTSLLLASLKQYFRPFVHPDDIHLPANFNFLDIPAHPHEGRDENCRDFMGRGQFLAARQCAIHERGDIRQQNAPGFILHKKTAQQLRDIP